MMENVPYSSGLTELWEAIQIQMISPKINKIYLNSLNFGILNTLK